MSKFISWLKSRFTPKKDATEIVQLPPKPKPIAPVYATSPQDPHWEYIADHIKIDEGREADAMLIASKIISNRGKYLLPLEVLTGVPWEFTGALFYREASLDFTKGLHCGEPWNKVTTLVPKGRGPFKSWVEAAIDAYQIKGYIGKSSWTFADCLARAEKFNGLGYRKKGIYSPYVCAATNFSEEKGKYVRDHVFDPNVTDKRVGVAAIMLALGFKERVVSLERMG